MEKDTLIDKLNLIKDALSKNMNTSYDASSVNQTQGSALNMSEDDEHEYKEGCKKCDSYKSEEALKADHNGQWSLHKKKRCWEGYEATPGKKPYEKGSCQPVKKDEVAPEDSNNKKTYKEAFKKNHIDMLVYDNGDIEFELEEDVPTEYENNLVKAMEQIGYEELTKKKKWSPKKGHKSKKGGLTEAGRKSYNRATGGNLKAPQPGGGPRKRSFCARNKGQIKMHGINCKKTPDKRACKARRRWKCTN